MNNPPAFPRPLSKVQEHDEITDDHNTRFSPAQSGMTLRDYFAAKALTGILANPNFSRLPANDAAEEAFLTADAMLAARENA